jgi:hypothetical protein
VQEKPDLLEGVPARRPRLIPLAKAGQIKVRGHANGLLDPVGEPEDGDRQSMISLRYGVRSVRQRPGSDEALCDRTR